MKVLVTGADGFVGRHVLVALTSAGHGVIACHGAAAAPPAWGREGPLAGVTWRPLELRRQESVTAVLQDRPDAVLHLAAVSSGAAARKDPGLAWEVNAAGTARLLEAASLSGSMPAVVVVSTGEVYGDAGRVPIVEEAAAAPVSPYAASKLGAEEAAREVARRTGLRVVIARPFAHTGPGQATEFVAPAFLSRIRAARSAGAATVATGNLEPVRDFLDVRDVAAAYVLLLSQGRAGVTYNIASGHGVPLRQLFSRLAALVGANVEPVTDPALVRSADIPYLVGNASRLAGETGWMPRYSLDQTLRDLTNAQAD